MLPGGGQTLRLLLSPFSPRLALLILHMGRKRNGKQDKASEIEIEIEIENENEMENGFSLFPLFLCVCVRVCVSQIHH